MSAKCHKRTPNSRVGDTNLAGWGLAGRVGADVGLHKFLFLKQQNAVAPKRSLDRDMASEKTARAQACRHQ